MYGLRTNKQRFNLFYLDESELYTEDFSGYCIYKSIHTKEDQYAQTLFYFLFSLNIKARKEGNFIYARKA